MTSASGRDTAYRTPGHRSSPLLTAAIRRILRARRHRWVMGVEAGLRTRIPLLNRAAKLGYARFRRRELEKAVGDAALLSSFAASRPLPRGYGRGMDERIVEYPWVLARLGKASRQILDAGSTLNFDWIAASQPLRDKQVTCFTLEPEGTLDRANYSYVYGDLRRTLLQSGSFDTVVCISSLEHVGMDNTLFYAESSSFRESDPAAFRAVLHELRRVLIPGGRLLLTVPYGTYQDLGWLQQFDRALLADAIEAFEGRVEASAYYRHSVEGWQVTHADACDDCRFLYVRSDSDPTLTVATAATAVACLELVRC